ncbi:MAG: hypothetical protein LBB67_01970 [Oscillospiraceae bacterium]|jgi:formylmethanofuran dehydrogenase subunit E|nr:hypothetical protein [Oscillospiraceae bacterium]
MPTELETLVELNKALVVRVEKLENQVAELAEVVGDINAELDEINELLLEDFNEDAIEVQCPNCGEVILIDAGTLEDGSVVCPKCEELLEFDFEDDCGCDDHCDCGGCK